MKLFKEIARYLISFIERLLYKLFSLVLVREMNFLNRPRIFNIIKTEYPWDFVRYSSLELVAFELNDNNIEGNVAEVGVYKGGFASKINECFPDRKFYLFDTFEGFPEQDLKRDKIYKLIHNKKTFISSNINLVLSKMKYPDQCEIIKGYFPDSLNNLEDKFAFISIDVDLFNPTYESLKYFYPRMAMGGFIFVHDYNNYEFGGAKDAVKEYCKENKINYFPLSDCNGSAIIIKGHI